MTDEEIRAFRDTMLAKRAEIYYAHKGSVKDFTSDATGEELSYSLNSEDMNDLAGLIELGNASGKYRAGNSKRFVSHTLQQLKQVKNEGFAYKYAAYEKLELLQDQISAATTVEEIEAITW